MPAFQNIQRQQEMKFALDFITECCIRRKNSKSKTVHNMAFYFYQKINEPDKLIRYLEDEERKKSNGRAIHLEVDYALNICHQNEKELTRQLNVRRTSQEYKKKQNVSNPNDEDGANSFFEALEKEIEDLKEQIKV
jgi:hypothetical protein